MRLPQPIPALCGLATLTALFATPLTAHAQTQALDFTGGITAGTSNNNPLGWEFSLSTTVTVTHLGIWDFGNDGLLNSHQLGLWSSTGTLLASTTMAPGTGAPSIVSGGGLGSFRYNPISSIVLTPGSYVISATYAAGDPELIQTSASSLSMGAGISFTQLRFDIGTGFAFPTQTAAANGHFGPNFQYITGGGTAAPEPGALALLALGGSLALVKRRRK